MIFHGTPFLMGEDITSEDFSVGLNKAMLLFCGVDDILLVEI